MKYIYHIVLVMTVLVSFSYAAGAAPGTEYSGKDIKAVLKRSYTAVTGLQSLSYDITYLHKSYTNNDTMAGIGSCFMKFDPSIKLGAQFALDIQFDSKATKTVRYNGRYAITRYTDSGHTVNNRIDINKEGLTWFNGSNIHNYVYNYIVHPKDLKRINSILYKHLIKDVSMIDTAINGHACFRIIVKTKNSNRSNTVTNGMTELIIDKEIYLPISICLTGTFEGIEMYDQYTFHIKAVNPELSDTVFNGEITGLPAEPVAVIPAAATENTSNTTRDTDMTVLPIPIINDDTITLSKYKGKVVVLDFWYRTCLPCLQLMPDIDKLSGEYKKEDVLILGINDIDSKETVAKYFSYKGYHYLSSYKNEHNISSLANIKENPTTVIIGKQGEVVQKIIGYDRGSYKEIKRAIEKELEQN